jgi:glutaredoxin 3|tara:strand:- start:37 stop:306 length:270 start_codon:yes stop_codon:yes gene_type:complete
MKNVVMYTQDLCGYCTAAAKEFEKRDWTYMSHNIKHEDNHENLKELLPEVRTVPQIWIDEVYIGGYDQLMEWLKTEDSRSSWGDVWCDM